jgi:hypothetical protein
MNADTIEKHVKNLLELVKTKSDEEINVLTEFDDFKKNGGKLLYEMILKNEFDPLIFKEMIKMKRRLESGEDQYSVDVRFGKFMAEKFIDPVVPPPPKPN